MAVEAKSKAITMDDLINSSNEVFQEMTIDNLRNKKKQKSVMN